MNNVASIPVWQMSDVHVLRTVCGTTHKWANHWCMFSQ